MKLVPIPEILFRAHPTSDDCLTPSQQTGGWRWDDSRVAAVRFHVLYTADSIIGALIEKLQRFGSDDEEAFALLTAFAGEPDDVPPPRQRIVPASVLREVAITQLHVLDPTQRVADPFDYTSLQAIAEIARQRGIAGIPLPLKAGDLGGTDYAVSQRVSVIIHDEFAAAGIVSRSSLDNPRDETIHSNYNLYRNLPADGGDLRVPLRRGSTALAVAAQRDELTAAFTHLGVEPELPLDHPDLLSTTKRIQPNT